MFRSNTAFKNAQVTPTQSTSSRNISRLDNTFKRAQRIGTFSANKGIRASGTINRADKADIFRFSLVPGQAFQYRTFVDIRGGSCNLSFFIRNPLNGRIQKIVGPLRIPPGEGVDDSGFFAQQVQRGTAYIKFDRPTANVRYSLRYAPISSLFR